jgi:alginate O-acetyltransferase complex protein AlgI
MLFNSWIFLPFFILVFVVYWALPTRWQNRWMILMGYIFYGAWDWRFLGLLLGTTIIDYCVGIALDRTSLQVKRKQILTISLCANLGALGFFKYFNFFASSMMALMHAFGIRADAHLIHIILPVGISFYTFQSMSYTIDVYRRKIPASRRFEDFVLYVSFFPQLVAGPIERGGMLLPQIEAPRTFRAEQFGEGLWLTLLGLFKKVVIADNLANVANSVFDAQSRPHGVACLLGLYAFAYQIYCDFSGYSDMARGLAKLLGFELMLNFNLPYLAQNPSEFWHRWHISLSTWLRDYLYIPLGGSRGGEAKTYRNLMITMLLGGLWHGASWTFILWGAFHGIALSLHRWLFTAPAAAKKADLQSKSLGLSIVSCFGMFQLTCLGWLLFRASSVHQVGSFISSIFMDFRPDAQSAKMLFSLCLFVLPLWALDLYAMNRDNPWWRPSWKWGLGPVIVASIFLALIFLTAPDAHTFIYFQF